MRFRKTTGARISLDSAWSKDAFAGGPGDGAGGGDLARGDAALRLAAEFGIGGLVFACTSSHAPFVQVSEILNCVAGRQPARTVLHPLQPLQPPASVTPFALRTRIAGFYHNTLSVRILPVVEGPLIG